MASPHTHARPPVHKAQLEGFPCDYCGVRPDVDCRHRPGMGLKREASGGPLVRKPGFPKQPAPVALFDTAKRGMRSEFYQGMSKRLS